MNKDIWKISIDKILLGTWFLAQLYFI